mmetsp:Transcript_103945/g.294519  ORF Transcript_103945/g.294519 Transcript_103945/m.294519 type:complete len:314 (-) Transcript_103945:601-1542(-)
MQEGHGFDLRAQRLQRRGPAAGLRPPRPLRRGVPGRRLHAPPGERGEPASGAARRRHVCPGRSAGPRRVAGRRPLRGPQAEGQRDRRGRARPLHAGPRQDTALQRGPPRGLRARHRAAEAEPRVHQPHQLDQRVFLLRHDEGGVLQEPASGCNRPHQPPHADVRAAHPHGAVPPAGPDAPGRHGAAPDPAVRPPGRGVRRRAGHARAGRRLARGAGEAPVPEPRRRLRAHERARRPRRERDLELGSLAVLLRLVAAAPGAPLRHRPLPRRAAGVSPVLPLRGGPAEHPPARPAQLADGAPLGHAVQDPHPAAA